MKNRESIGITLQEGEPDFMEWMATYHPEVLKTWATRYLRSIALHRAAKHNNPPKTDTSQSAP